MPATIFLVRHAQSEANRDGVFSGHDDPPLTDHGRAQAAALQRRLRDVDIARVWTSDLARAGETARLIVGQRSIPITTDERLREMNFGEWEGKAEDFLAEHFRANWDELMRPSADFRAPGGESLAEVRARMTAVYNDVVTSIPDGVALLVSHGNAIGALLAALLGMPFENSWRLQLANGGLTRIHHVDDTPVIVHLNDTSHLDDAGHHDKLTP